MSDSILTGKKIWLTGASRGIGLATAKLLAESGAVIIASSSDYDVLHSSLTEQINNKRVIPLKCDVSKAEEVDSVYKKILSQIGILDILINNAGIGIFKSFLETNEEDFNKTIDINLRGPFLTQRAVLPEMIKHKSGTIMNILSVAVNSRFLNSSVYSASKSALFMMDRIIREEVRQYGIKIIDVLPGATISRMWTDREIETNGFRMMKPEDIAISIKQILELNSSGNLMTEEIVIKPQMGDL